ncbi:UNVERIFIED_CONTAM: hypothetical protein RMT77_015749 [Armadillidium vulgare]
MLSEGRRDGLRLALSRSLSEPGVPGVPTEMPIVSPTSPQPPFSALFAPSQVVSMPASPCADSTTIQRSILLRRSRTIEPVDLARRLTKAQKMRSFLLVDVRSFVAFNMSHIRSAINLNCSDRINRRRLLQRKAGVVDLAVSPAGRDVLKKRCFKEVIVYDDSSRDIELLSQHHPVLLVLMALLEDNRDPLLLKGGFHEFESAYPELCEDALMRPKAGSEYESSVNTCYLECPAEDGTVPVTVPPPSPCGNENAIETAQVAQVLPFLYLGNAKDAQDSRILEAHGIQRVLNVTSLPPPPPDGRDRKTLPAHDSGQQNLMQYFDEAIDYIDEARRVGERVLVHCQAGVSRSPTIVLAYLMKHTRMTMVEAYKLLKARRPVISPNLNFMGQLVEWETTLQASKTEADCKPCHQCQWQKQEANKVPNACHV